MSRSVWWGISTPPEARDIHDPERLTGGIMATDAEREALDLAEWPAS